MAKRDVQRRIDNTAAFAASTYVVSSSGGGGMAVHALSSAYHTGSLADAQAPQFLLLSGTRAMLGNLDMGGMSVTNVNLVDGEDVSGHGVRLGVLEARRVYGGSGLTDSGNNLLDGHITLNLAPLSPYSGLDVQADSVAIADSLAGNGLDIANKILSVRTGRGLEIVSDDVRVDEDFSFLWTGAHRWQISAVDTVVVAPAYKTLSVNWGNPDGSYNSAIRAQAGAVTDRTLYLKAIAAQTGEIMRVENVAGDALIKLTHEGDLESGNPGFVSGLTGWQIAHTGDAEFNNLVARGEFHASVFSADELHAQGGTMTMLTATKVAPPLVSTDNVLGALNAAFTLVVQASYDTGLCYFAQNDIIRAKFMGPVDAGQALDLWDVFLTVSGAPVSNSDRDMAEGNPGTHDVPVVLRMGGQSGLDIPAGTAIVKWGRVGQTGGTYTGGLLLTTDLAQAPYMDVYTVAADKAVAAWSGVPPTIKPRVRVGNLDGVLGLSEQWGMAAGTDLSDTSDDARYLVASDTQFKLHNIDLDMWSSAARRVYMTAAGNVQFGTNVSAAASTTFDFTASTGALRIGPGSGGAHINWTGTNLEVRNSADAAVITLAATGNSYFSGVMTIAAGGEIRQGSVTAGNVWGAWPLTNFTGLRIWNDTGIGRIGGYNLNTLQWEADSNGRIQFGGGAGLLGQYGLNMDYVTTSSVPVPTHTLSGINWWADATAANPASQMPKVRAYGYKITGAERYGFQVDINPASGPAMWLEDGGTNNRFFAMSGVDVAMLPGASFTGTTASLLAVSLAGSVTPQTHNIYNLGSNSNRFANVYATNIIADSITGSVPLTGQTWQHDAANMYIKSTAAANRMLYIQNDNGSYTLSVTIEGNLTVNGTITGSSGSDHPAVTIGAGGDSALLSINPSTQVLTLADITTAAVSESGNLYYTDARARAAVSGSAGISYNSGTGAFTLDANVAGAGLAISGGVMSVGVSGLGLSTDANNVILTSSNDVSAGGTNILASTGGALILRSLTVSGGNFAIGSWFNTNTATGQVAIGKAVDDPQYTLDIVGAVKAEYFVGQHALQLPGALLIAHYDGRLIPGNYFGDPNGHMGQIATVSGVPEFQPGKFGKAIVASTGGANKLTYGNFEAFSGGLATGWNAYATGSGGGSRSQDTRAKLGTYCQLINRTAGAAGDRYGISTTSSAIGATTANASIWFKVLSYSNNAIVRLYVDYTGGPSGQTSSVTLNSATVAQVGEWQQLSVASTVDSGDTANLYVWVEGANAQILVDCAQVEAVSGGTPFTATSRATTLTNYPLAGNLLAERGTVMMWALKSGGWGAGHGLFRAGSANAYFDAYISSAGTLNYRIHNTVSITKTGVTAGVWHHYAFTWDINADELKLFVDGVQAGTTQAMGSLLSLASIIEVGSIISGASIFNGLIDEFVVLDHALSDRAVQAVYDSDAPVFAESSRYGFRATPNNLIWADDSGFWIKDSAGKEVFGVSTADNTAWGGISDMDTGDVLIGRSTGGGAYILWDTDGDSGAGRLDISANLTVQSGTAGLLRYGTNGSLPIIFAGSAGTSDAQRNAAPFRVYPSGDVFVNWIYGGSDGKMSLRPFNGGTTTFYLDLVNSHNTGANFKYAKLNLGYELTTETATLSIGGYEGFATRNGVSQLRFVTSTTSLQASLTRYAGLNGVFALQQTGDGDLKVATSGLGDISFEVAGVERMTFDNLGKLRLASSETGVAKIAPLTSFTLNDSATYNFTTWPTGLVLITVYDTGSAAYEAGLFLSRGGSAAYVALVHGGGTMTATKDNAGTLNFYYYNSAYTIQNRRGGSRNISVTVLGHPLGI